jgi:hypothetical protein
MAGMTKAALRAQLKQQAIAGQLTPEQYAEKLRALRASSKVLKNKGLLERLGGTGGLKGLGSQALLLMILNRLANVPAERGQRKLQEEAIAAQGRTSAEDIYYQAALPQAQAEEEEARQALFNQIAGGVVGPQLARGERMIGG